MKRELTIITVILNHIPQYSMALGERLVQTSVHCWGNSVCLLPGDGHYIVKASGKACMSCTVKQPGLHSASILRWHQSQSLLLQVTLVARL